MRPGGPQRSPDVSDGPRHLQGRTERDAEPQPGSDAEHHVASEEADDGSDRRTHRNRRVHRGAAPAVRVLVHDAIVICHPEYPR